MFDESSGSACGKIILTGEYAVVFGERGIAVPSKEKISVTWKGDRKINKTEIVWEDDGVEKEWIEYVQKILKMLNVGSGTLTIESKIPLGKGMGSSTALVIALCRCFLGDECQSTAMLVENEMNPGASGIDFAVIWANKPVVFQKNTEPEIIEVPHVLKGTRLLDTGRPNETTKELVAFVTKQGKKVQSAIETIGKCTERIFDGDPIKDIIKDHHRAQVELGVVPKATQKVIADIEKKGGAAKVIGAGGKTGGGGMVLVFP